MFRVLDVPREGLPTVCDRASDVGPPPEGIVRWIDFEGPSDEHLSLLGDRFGFHPLALEDSAHFDQRPKLDDYDAYLFVVTHGFESSPGRPLTAITTRELHAFIGDRHLVTIHTDPIPALDGVYLRAYGDASVGRRGADFLYYLVLDAIVDANFPILDALTETLESIEDAVLDHQESTHLRQIFELKRTMTAMRRILIPQRHVFTALTKHREPLICAPTVPYFRDVHDHLLRTHEALESARDLLANARDAYLSAASNRTNDIMKRLAVMSAIFLPLTFVTGFFGQNFTHMPFESELLLLAMVLSCIAIPTGMLIWFYRTKWI